MTNWIKPTDKLRKQVMTNWIKPTDKLRRQVMTNWIKRSLRALMLAAGMVLLLPTAVQAQDLSNMMIRGSVGLSVAFGVASVLVVSVVQRGREIGILRAMGARRGQVLRVFLIQGGLMGVFGALLGAALGGSILAVFLSQARQLDGTELFPFLLDPWLIVVTVALAGLVGVVAAMAPALQAARLDPAAAIRG